MRIPGMNASMPITKAYGLTIKINTADFQQAVPKNCGYSDLCFEIDGKKFEISLPDFIALIKK